MENVMRILILLFAALSLSGCVARLAADVITAPIKVGAAVVDATTTSQAEADRNRGRDMRKADERDEKARKKSEKEARRRARDSEAARD
jgi:hypothetical protein